MDHPETIYKDVWENEIHSTTARSAAEAAELVERIASLLSDAVTPLPSSDCAVAEEYVYHQVG